MKKGAQALHYDISLDWSELDILGHINNVAYFKYIQAARINLLQHIGLWTAVNEKPGNGAMLASIKLDFRKPLLFPGTIRIISEVAFIGTSSFGLHHRVYDQNGEIAAEAQGVIVYYDYQNDQKQPLTRSLKEKLQTLCIDTPQAHV